jgi:hypothetical protein
MVSIETVLTNDTALRAAATAAWQAWLNQFLATTDTTDRLHRPHRDHVHRAHAGSVRRGRWLTENFSKRLFQGEAIALLQPPELLQNTC